MPVTHTVALEQSLLDVPPTAREAMERPGGLQGRSLWTVSGKTPGSFHDSLPQLTWTALHSLPFTPYKWEGWPMDTSWACLHRAVRVVANSGRFSCLQSPIVPTDRLVHSYALLGMQGHRRGPVLIGACQPGHQAHEQVTGVK